MPRYNIDLLQQIICRDLCSVDVIPESLNIRTSIDFKCQCGERYIKKFIQLFVVGGFCKTCTFKKRKEKIKNTCLEKYGVESAFQSKQVQEKIKNTCLEKYGVESVFQSKQVQEKIKNTCLEKYGVENATQTKQAQEKRKNTCLEKYGTESAFQSKQVHEKYEKTCMEKYGVINPSKLQSVKDKKVVTCLIKNGVTNPSKSQDIQDKKVATCISKYGTNNAVQNPEILEKILKSRYQFKKFIFPDGIEIKVQGYEPWALQELVDEGFNSQDIVTDKRFVPEIWYIDKNNKKSRYFVDIFIPSLNKMIEVKSTWTIKSDKEKVYSKAKECLSKGYIYEIWVYSDKKTKQVISEF